MHGACLCRSVVGPDAERGEAAARPIDVDAGLRYSAASANEQRADVVESADIGQSADPERRRRTPAGVHRAARHQLNDRRRRQQLLLSPSIAPGRYF